MFCLCCAVFNPLSGVGAPGQTQHAGADACRELCRHPAVGASATLRFVLSLPGEEQSTWDGESKKAGGGWTGKRALGTAA
jgi:hypothetical protein